MSRADDAHSKLSLLRAAEHLFAEHGVAGAKVEDVERAAGLSNGAFDLQFESKEAALTEIVERWLARCGALFAGPSDYPDAADDPYSLLDFCIERDVRMYQFLWDTRATLRLLRSCQGQYDALFDAFRAEIRRRNRDWLDQWRRDGLVRPEADLELASTLMSGAHEELSTKMAHEAQRPPIEEWVEFAQETFVRAFGTQELIAALERRNRRAITGVHERGRATLGVADAPLRQGRR